MSAQTTKIGTEPVNAGHPGRPDYLRWLLEVTALPTAAGREDRVIAWVERWVGERPDLAMRRDEHGNIEIRFAEAAASAGKPVYFTAHMDHPAFVVEGVEPGRRAILSFRGGVMAEYFEDARVRVHAEGGAVGGVLVEKVFDPKEEKKEEAPSASLRSAPPPSGTGEGEADSGGAPVPRGLAEKSVFPLYACALDSEADIAVGDIAVWELPAPEIIDDEFGGILHTNACDDLAALVAALCAMEELRMHNDTACKAVPPGMDVRLLLTRAEEIGFVGAIGACKSGIIAGGARVIALENSRSFADSPIHGGPIVRVGDRVSVFSPELTAAVADVARKIAGRDAQPLATEKNDRRDACPTGIDDRRGACPAVRWKWQRKLMAGGACEASVFCAYGHTATCVCLPLGNYHNMGDLDAVQGGTNESRPRVGREYIGLDDFFGMVDLLVGCGVGLGDRPAFAERVEKLWDGRRFVLA